LLLSILLVRETLPYTQLEAAQHPAEAAESLSAGRHR
jgi:hypothetical protein